MKKQLFFALTLCGTIGFTACKSQESAYKQAYERAKAQAAQNNANTAVAVTTTPTDNNAQTVSMAPVTVAPVDHSDVRTINGGFNVVSGTALKTYSVVVGSFINQVNAESLLTRLKKEGYDARLIKTNETINGQTGWFRVIASSYAEKADAAASRDQLRAKFAGAWLLYTK